MTRSYNRCLTNENSKNPAVVKLKEDINYYFLYDLQYGTSRTFQFKPWVYAEVENSAGVMQQLQTGNLENRKNSLIFQTN